MEVKSLWTANGLHPPVAMEVTSPVVRCACEGMEITLTFQIEENGTVSNIRCNDSPFDPAERNFASCMQRALQDWKFVPCLDKEGNPVAVTVMLPVQVVARGNGNAGEYSTVMASRPHIVATTDR
jgi:hypothetical protein